MKSRVGEENLNTFGSKMKIVEYIKSNNIIVEFENGYKTKTSYFHFIKGEIKSPYEKRLCKIGYLGEGNYFPIINKKETPSYRKWTDMIYRCYSESKQNNRPTYIDCSVCEEWHNFQNFSKWFNENYYEIENEKMCLDKDILIKGNKIYSPDTCVFVPERINNLLLLNKKKKSDFLTGIIFNKRSNSFQSKCSTGNGTYKSIGYYKSEEEANLAYISFKENFIKKIAEEYKNKIPEKVYISLINYKI